MRPDGAPTLGHVEAGRCRAMSVRRHSMAGGRPIERSRHEVGNPASQRPALRLRNHDVHLHPLRRTTATRRRNGLSAAWRCSSARPSRMRIHVLGSAAGGGFPQWNCNCRNCDGVRRGTLNATPRTQSSIAVSGDGTNWLLVQRLARHPRAAARSAGAAAGARAARHGDRARVLLDRCADRSHDRPLHAARASPAARRLVHRSGARGSRKRQSAVPRARPLLRRRLAPHSARRRGVRDADACPASRSRAIR